jgi:hypothetical protein
MSYCRFGADSDVYVYPSFSGIVCCACRMGQDEPMDAAAMLAHLRLHERGGDVVPGYAIERLMDEIALSAPTASGLQPEALGSDKQEESF